MRSRTLTVAAYSFALATLLLAMLGPLSARAQTPGPDGSGRIINGSIPPDGGFGLIVFSGGTYDQLVAASGCAEGQAVFWITQNGAFVVYLPATTVGAVNAPFESTFPNRTIPPFTPFLGRCAPLTDSGIAGVVTLGPLCPVQSDLLPCPDRPYEATLVALDAQGHEAGRVTSGTDGRYRIALPAGTFTLVPLSPNGQPYPRATSVSVRVEAGSYTTVNVMYDTGIRSAQ